MPESYYGTVRNGKGRTGALRLKRAGLLALTARVLPSEASFHCLLHIISPRRRYKQPYLIPLVASPRECVSHAHAERVPTYSQLLSNELTKLVTEDVFSVNKTLRIFQLSIGKHEYLGCLLVQWFEEKTTDDWQATTHFQKQLSWEMK